ncbi:hypothetical protein EDD86DRAFT_210599, partial [Gorgonomyces haynaldii]
MRKELLVVFVHGFMGSEESFQQFPKDLMHLLNDPGVECVRYPTYSTSGSFQLQVQKLMDWLLLFASTHKYKQTILCGHSMGGLLAVEAYRHLYSVSYEPDTRLQRIYNFIKPWITYTVDRHPPDDIRVLVNVIGILTFDSPFYGITNKVYFLTGVNKTVQVAKDMPKILPQMVSMDAAVDNVIPNEVLVPVINNFSVPVSTKWVKDKAKEHLRSVNPGPPQNGPDEPSNQATNQPEQQQETERSVADELVLYEDPNQEQPKSWSHYMLLGGQVAAASLAALGLAAALEPVASAWTVSAAEQVRHHLEFLDPILMNIDSRQHRVYLMQQEQLHKRFLFHQFAMRLPDNVHFCIEPPKEQEPLLTWIDSPLLDEIDAHMSMFEKNQLHYQHLLDTVSKYLKEFL